jgi:hypothetical protein
MEKKWDTVTPADLKRLFVSGKYMSRWSRKDYNCVNFEQRNRILVEEAAFLEP